MRGPSPDSLGERVVEVIHASSLPGARLPAPIVVCRSYGCRGRPTTIVAKRSAQGHVMREVQICHLCRKPWQGRVTAAPPITARRATNQATEHVVDRIDSKRALDGLLDPPQRLATKPDRWLFTLVVYLLFLQSSHGSVRAIVEWGTTDPAPTAFTHWFTTARVRAAIAEARAEFARRLQ